MIWTTFSEIAREPDEGGLNYRHRVTQFYHAPLKNYRHSDIQKLNRALWVLVVKMHGRLG
ncbi:hypothetical protein KCP77_23280 [Salmonella enterica subsp. enterica]|nr:hypothetical protein KCP77_23280 [Salmonella enterica subsp. enterica]